MRNWILALVAIDVVCSSLCSNLARGQLLAPAKRAAQVKIVKGPALESVWNDLAILRWTSTNPGGDDDHFAIAHYGTSPGDLNETARSHIRLNRNHSETIFRVRLAGLKPGTTYYYWVTSMGADGIEDGVKSAVSKFTTSSPGNRIVNYTIAK